MNVKWNYCVHVMPQLQTGRCYVQVETHPRCTVCEVVERHSPLPAWKLVWLEWKFPLPLQSSCFTAEPVWIPVLPTEPYQPSSGSSSMMLQLKTGEGWGYRGRRLMCVHCQLRFSQSISVKAFLFVCLFVSKSVSSNRHRAFERKWVISSLEAMKGDRFHCINQSGPLNFLEIYQERKFSTIF